MTPLRQRFVDDLRLRNYSPRTIQIYVAHVARFAKHFGRSPDTLGPEEMRAFQLHQLERKVSWSQFNQAVSALRFLYGKTLGRTEQVPHCPHCGGQRFIRIALPKEEMQPPAPGGDTSQRLGRPARSFARTAARPGSHHAAASAIRPRGSYHASGVLRLRIRAPDKPD